MDSKIDRIISIIRNLKEDGGGGGGAAAGLGGAANYSGSSFSGPTNSLAQGKIAGTSQAGDYPPVDLRKGKRRNWNPFFKDLAKVQRRKSGKNK